MKKLRFLPFILALALPLSGCDLFNKKSDTPDTPQTEKTVTGITAVHAPETVDQNTTLPLKSVSLDISYSDSSTGSVNPERISLDTSTLGEKTGTAFYGQFYKDFSINVVMPSDVQPTEILSVHAPSSIGQGETLLPSNVTLDVKFSDDTIATYAATNVVLDTSSAGTIEGKAYYGNLNKAFTIVVISQEQSKSYTELRDSILNNHNYTIDVLSYYENFTEERYEGSMYNLNNKVFYGTDPEYPNLFVRGYTTVKDQGIAEFLKSVSSDEVVIQNFIATNPDLTIYDIHSYLIEYILESNLTLVEPNHYRTNDQDLADMVAQYSNLELSYISNPEYIDIYKIGNTIKIVSVLTANYYDPETLEPVENEPVYVGLTVRSIGFTSDVVLENFAVSESSKVADPVEWDSELVKDFNEHHNGYIPPFISGLSYSFHHSTDWNGYRQKYEIKGQDFVCGDKRSTYASVLVEQEGYSLVEENVYEKRVPNEGHTMNQVYRVEMNYIPTSQSYAGKTIGYYYIGGIFQITFLTYTEITTTVNSVASLNTYIDSTAASEIMPRFPSAFNTVEVQSFDDRTEINNQLYGGGFIFATSLTSYFKIKVAAYSDAQSFYSLFKTAANAKGYTREETNPILCTTSFSDEGNSYIELSRPESFGSANYPGYLQCRICIREYHATYEVDFEKDEGIGTITPSTLANVEAGQKIVFSFIVKEGYELDEVTCPKPEVVITKEAGENQYSFIMPESDVVISITSNSSAAEEGLAYDYAYTTYVRNNSGTLEEYSEPPTGAIYSKLTLTFNEDATGQYKRVKYNSSGAEISGGTYIVNFTYSLVNGQFTLIFVDGDNTGFDKWRLFDQGTAGHGNDQGTFSENKITIKVYDSNENPTTIHLA